MELHRLRYFVTVVEEGSFTRAAARLRLAQPGLSAQIARLERELGQRLLDRAGRTVTPTEVGTAVLPYARAALAAAEAVRDTAAEFAGLLRGRVSLGLVPGAGIHLFDLAGLLADFHADHPGVEVALSEGGSEEMLTAVREGRLDFALAGLPGPGPLPGLRLRPVVDCPLVAAVAPGDPLAQMTGTGDGLPLTALRGRRLISLPRGTGVRGVLDGLCAEAGFTAEVGFEAAAPRMLARLAARGMGVAVLPALAPEVARELGVVTVPLAAAGARGRVALAWRTGTPPAPAARELLGRLREALPTPYGTTVGEPGSGRTPERMPGPVPEPMYGPVSEPSPVPEPMYGPVSEPSPVPAPVPAPSRTPRAATGDGPRAEESGQERR
ncbi:LysR substrate-binding domain-containing protein [Streptomyces sp.]|uniref:LysR substrate-binding domain-containing protein n=1 Tax=Streptomyces sp. TaxID=1931 RepID=UPI00281256AF|nr:LysR substrate-binding domain-containing protein [Streptomyces sp.]